MPQQAGEPSSCRMQLWSRPALIRFACCPICITGGPDPRYFGSMNSQARNANAKHENSAAMAVILTRSWGRLRTRQAIIAKGQPLPHAGNQPDGDLLEQFLRIPTWYAKLTKTIRHCFIQARAYSVNNLHACPNYSRHKGKGLSQLYFIAHPVPCTGSRSRRVPVTAEAYERCQIVFPEFMGNSCPEEKCRARWGSLPP